MAFQHWIPPPSGTLKINVHGYFAPFSHLNGNKSGIGAIYRNDHGELKLLTIGVISFLSKLGNELWAMFSVVRRANIHKYDNIILEIDNYEAFQVIKHFHLGASAAVFDIDDQLDTIIKDKRWSCVMAYVYPSHNIVHHFLARLAYETCEELYTLDMPVGGIKELLDRDMGLGIDHPDFLDVFITLDKPGPVNFDVALTMGEQINDLGLGQINAPTIARVKMELQERKEILEGALEEYFVCKGGMEACLLFSWDPPLGDKE